MFVIEEELKKLPDQPGVYIMHDSRDAIIYIGKAVSLRKRVHQYFQPSHDEGIKKAQMVKQIARFEYIVTDSELEALVLECNLIKEHRPKYNTMLRDDKTYPYIRVTLGEDFPRVLFSRQQKKDRAAKWLRILCLSIFSVILLAFLFFTGAFLFIQNEANLDEALFTLALGAFAIGLLLFRDGIPILLLAIALPPLLCRRPRQPAKTIVCILLSVLSVLWLIFGGHFLWLQLF